MLWFVWWSFATETSTRRNTTSWLCIDFFGWVHTWGHQKLLSGRVQTKGQSDLRRAQKRLQKNGKSEDEITHILDVKKQRLGQFYYPMFASKAHQQDNRSYWWSKRQTKIKRLKVSLTAMAWVKQLLYLWFLDPFSSLLYNPFNYAAFGIIKLKGFYLNIL